MTVTFAHSIQQLCTLLGGMQSLTRRVQAAWRWELGNRAMWTGRPWGRMGQNSWRGKRTRGPLLVRSSVPFFAFEYCHDLLRKRPLPEVSRLSFLLDRSSKSIMSAGSACGLHGLARLAAAGPTDLVDKPPLVVWLHFLILIEVNSSVNKIVSKNG